MKLDVIKHSRLYLSLSGLFILAGIIAMFVSWQQIGLPLRPAIDFTGGTRLTLELDCGDTTKPAGNPAANTCSKLVDIVAVRQAIAAKGYTNSVVQQLDNGRGVIVQTGDLEVEKRTELQTLLESILKGFGQIDPKKSQIERVGPAIGNQLLTSGLQALGISFLGIAIYLGFRFQADYAIFAVIALFHDIFVTVGIFSILGLTMGVEVDSLFIVAMLTVCGFSVNDTVIIYDRIRENLKIQGRDHDFNDLVNLSVNQTLARSINTTLTATLPLIAIFIFGGATLKYFSLALIIGFLSGAYSSIFNASILLAWWRNRNNKTNQTPSVGTNAV
ncbi:protein translocase subunit SecF [Tumidithrix elongata RA019]|uniref:Protein-export membrane protein SecF n=1 Tax=Tumidithrix elongata BACA0141 TaxID=2716417 RepID=A0AAW9Q5B3_9CYAN|nr:protein translocase subunit SecF [Tumidithrix elongata RA019]